ncbi:hypothetical protein Sjap_004952 [Stephania japonica]|uniref:PPPDE domain-containing protein n=1 Tax=Stephania japonica TaxID=461633 RepID=A0AAP0K4I0_9MAGN
MGFKKGFRWFKKVVFKTKGDLGNALAEAEEEVVNIATALGENTLSLFFKLEKRDGTPKDQLSSIKQTLKELQCKREERMKEFCDIQSQITQVHEALHGNVVDEHIVDDKDLTTKRLRELKLVLQGLQSEKAARSAGVPMILDAGGMDGLIPADLLTNVDIFSPNETELERLTGMPTESFEQISQSVAKIHEMMALEQLLKNKEVLLFYCVESEALAWKVAHLSDSIKLQSINWRSFDDGFPNLFINNAQDIRGQHVAFLASFSSPSVIFEQLSIIFALPRLCLLLRLHLKRKGMLLLHLPWLTDLCLVYHYILPLEINIDLIILPFSMKLVWMELLGISIAFPDDGDSIFPMIVCNKVREGDKRIVRLKEGNLAAHHVVIVDDLIIQVHKALHGSVVDEHIVDDKDLTTKRLRELKLVLQGLQSEKKRNPRFAPVYLNVYDLHPINGSIHWLGLGLYHSGIQGHDSPSTGIFRGKPRECPGLTLRKSILIGRTDLGPHEVHKFMEELSKSYTGTSYNLITKNCNHFCNDVSLRLTGK